MFLWVRHSKLYSIILNYGLSKYHVAKDSKVTEKCSGLTKVREGFKKEKKLVEYSTKGLTPPPLPPLVDKIFIR